MRNKLILGAFLLLLLTGCWDSKEIEDIGVIIGLGVDTAEEVNEITMTNQYVDPGKIPSIQGGAPGGKPFQNLTVSGTTLLEIIRDNAFESNRPPNYTHLKSIMLSSRLLDRERADEVIDLLIRDHEFRRTTPVFITKDRVEDVMAVEPTKELFPAIQIKDLGENAFKNLYVPENLKIGEMSKFISEEKSFLIPGMKISENLIKSDGAAIISKENFQIAGWLEKEDMAGVRYIINDVRGGYINLTKKEIQDGPLSLEVKEASTAYDPIIKGENITMEFNIKVNVSLAEDWGNSRNHFKKGWKKEVEKATNAKIEHAVKIVLTKAQEEYKTDFLNLSNWVRIHQPEYWKKNEKRWDEVFPEMQTKINVKTKITDFGTQNLK
ncbi:Ger(x)C family spore germination protein [Halobacillus mangrovi]|uniref:Ger(x)C family spore germination protein n=1 Tax=Halobacillus mangrovi TaxID=402384 RepID=UPI003D964638